MIEVIVRKELKQDVTKMNPFVFDMPVAGLHILVFNALNSAFLQEVKVFAGSVDQFVKLAVEAGMSEDNIRLGFEELASYGYLTINGDTFIPTEKYVNRFS